MALGVLDASKLWRRRQVSGLGLTYDNQTPDDATKALQILLSGLLSAKGMAPITADGKLGPATCGAARWLDQNTGSALQAQYGLTSICQSYTDPKPAGSATTPKPVVVSPSSSATSPNAFEADQGSTILGLPLQTVGIIGLGAVGFYFFMQKGKKKGATT